MAHDDHPHPHPLQPDHPEPQSRAQVLGLALNALLIKKGVYTADDLRRTMETIEMVTPETHGARVVARAWCDADFKAALLDDGYKAVKDMGLEPGYRRIDRAGEHARGSQRRRLHAVFVLSAHPLGPTAGLVQKQGIPCPRGLRAPRGIGRIRARDRRWARSPCARFKR